MFPHTVYPVAIVPGGVGYLELLLLFALILLVFGPKRLPELARKLGGFMETLRKAANQFHQNVLAMDDIVEDDVDPAEAPVKDADTPGGDDGSVR